MVDKNLFIGYAPQLYDIGKKIADGYKRELRNADSVASGALLNFKWDVKNDNNGLKLVFYLPEYYVFIESGRLKTKNGGNGQVRRKIREWILDKGIEPSVKYDKRGRKYLPSKDQLAYLITRKIHQNGFFGNNSHGKQPLKKAIENNRDLRQQFVDTATKMYTEQLNKMMVELNVGK